jgi:hypothetical protein
LHINAYFVKIRQHISNSPFVTSVEINEDIRTSTEGFIKAKIRFIDDSELSFREFVSTENPNPFRYTYAYHYTKNNSLIFRYDSAPHHKEVSTFPHHKHLADGMVESCSEPTIDSILSEIESIIPER